MSHPFRFKKFEILHDQSTMKVGTDAIVLGSWLKVDDDCKTILDIGTGCGVIALMLAQRTKTIIHAIDIDEPSALEAEVNFNHSPWNDRLKIHQSSLEKFNPPSNIKYDLIVSNPPFFQNSLLPLSSRLQVAKHNVAFTMESFVANIHRLLANDGKWAVILPAEMKTRINSLAEENGYEMLRNLNVFSKAGKPLTRIVAVFGMNNRANTEFESLTIRGEDGRFTDQYKKLTQDYHPEGYL